MSSGGYHRSRMFQVSASLLLSTAYFVAAIGVWMVGQGQLNSSADTTSNATISCTPAHQTTAAATDITSAKGWTITQLPSQALPDVNGGNAYATVMNGISGQGFVAYGSWNISHALSSSKQGSVSIGLTTQATTITLSTATGVIAGLRQRVTESTPTNHIDYYAATAGGYTEIFASASNLPILGTYGYGDPNPGRNLEFRWTAQGYDIYLNGTKLTPGSGPIPFPSDMKAGLNLLTIQTSDIPRTPTPPNEANLKSAIPNTLTINSLSFPDGTAVPCLTKIDPSTAQGGATVTLNGNQFEKTGMKVTLKDNTGKTTEVDPASVTPAAPKTDGTAQALGADSLTFVIPSGLANGSYTVGVTNSAGPSQQGLALTIGNTTACAAQSTVTDTFDQHGAELVGRSTTLIGSSYAAVTSPWTANPPMQADTTAFSSNGAGVVTFWSNGNIAYPLSAPLLAVTGNSSASRTFDATAQGKVSFDLIPHWWVKPSTAGTYSFTAALSSSTGTRSSLTIADSIAPQATGFTDSKVLTITGPTGQVVNAPDSTSYFGTAGFVNNGGITSSTSGHLELAWGNGTMSVSVAGHKLGEVPVDSSTKFSLLTVSEAAANQGTWAEDLIDTVAIQTGSPAACLSSISPTTAKIGDTVTLKGSGFEASGMTVTLKDGSGTVTTVKDGITVNSDKTQLTFVVPSGTKDGGYAVGVTTSAGASQNTLALTVGSGTTVTTADATLNVNPTTGPAPLTVIGALTGSVSGTVTWDFGDGSQPQSGTDTTVRHTYSNPGSYTLKVTVNGVALTPVTVTVGTAATHADTTNNGGGTTTTTAPTPAKGPTTSTGGSIAAAAKTLTSSGGSLAVNLGLAALFSLITTYALLHRRSA